MDPPKLKSVAVFSRPFTVPGFGELLPAGAYDIETKLSAPPDDRNHDAGKALVLIKLHPRNSHPGLSRTLTVSLGDLDAARAKDELTGKELSELFLEEMLVDPMVRLFMEADGVSEMQLRQLFWDSRSRNSETVSDVKSPVSDITTPQDIFSIQVAENEGMPPRQN